MKIRKPSLAFLTVLLLGTSTFIGGCATTGMERAAKTTTSMQTVENEYRQTATQVDATTATLNDLIKPDQADQRKAFEAYKASVARMDNQGKQLTKNSDEMNARGKDYFAEWEKSGNKYTNPEMRELSEQRRSEMSQVFAQIPEASIGVKGSLRSYVTELKEIQTYLSNDLTPKGIETITPMAQKAIKDGENLKVSIKPVLAAIQNVRTEMAQGGTTGRGAAAGGSQDSDIKENMNKDIDKD
ncbi:MAG TPA: DUF2959 family protein [Desulfuromonadaceae bacterium]|jgi:hypothetical protein